MKTGQGPGKADAKPAGSRQATGQVDAQESDCGQAGLAAALQAPVKEGFAFCVDRVIAPLEGHGGAMTCLPAGMAEPRREWRSVGGRNLLSSPAYLFGCGQRPR